MRKGPLGASSSFTIGSDCTTMTIQNAVTTTSSASVARQTSLLRNHRRRQASLHCTSSTLGLMDWLQSDCPNDLIPRVLAFAGPQTAAALSQTSKFWKEVMDQESTWRSLCEELYKWKEGDEEPESWRDFYKFTPCVPVDYATVHGALAVVKSPEMEQTHSIRVLLRPGRYVLREAIIIQASRSVRVEIDTMKMPDSFLPIDQTAVPFQPDPARKRKPSQSLRNILSCRTIDVEHHDDELSGVEVFDPSMFNSNTGAKPLCDFDRKRATLVLRTRRYNEPIMHIRQGTAILRNLELKHVSNGSDIWNGNAAVQIQPSTGFDEQSMLLFSGPKAILENVAISSATGRGIVNIDGGQMTVRNCYVHDCAATGIYVGGPESRAYIERTDVVRNGNGNNTHRRGIARGHSGVYLEQGHARIVDCNISLNCLTGVSAVSPDNAILDLEQSELVSNGSFQLEMPAVGTPAHTRSSTVNNTFSASGLPRSRSGLAREE